ncbi:ABC-type sugar transport systems, permease component [Oceanicola granulosus HTCC2516]|uniref:ABC-type sugar transport systems, permease component n=1 Tax=Oceanicola granulosus (strain ATCC BAA-861 / DSM 15982 / KCTC 12143 / HTCC2516) TaxID=314256 RepID=Q2CH54_OCEGH|nr:sugar ABC transporter permease [Oceanicola granulosus]EAR51957.1 ABC-type sugar transport systems, permease component [Oceanicola granulosus HTCC2516]
MSDAALDRQEPAARRRTARRRVPYPYTFYIPAGVIYAVMFLVPTIASFYFALTRWTLFDSHFIGFGNFVQFFREPFLVQGLVNTLIFGISTSALKVVLGLALAVLLTSRIPARGYLRAVIFFPVLVSFIGVGIIFVSLMHPTRGAINVTLETIGIDGPGWLTTPWLALYSVIIVDVWKGVGIATVIFIAGIASIPSDYYEAARIDGATKAQQFWRITLPLSRPATVTVITLSLIGGLRTFDLIWTMTGGGPGFSSDVVASIIYKQYQSGFYGLSTAGNVVLFLLIALVMVPLTTWMNRREIDI